jgi:uncharacterized membrane protein YsdA (DUF1294 family)
LSPPAIQFGLVSFSLAASLAAGIWWVGLDPLLSWLLSVTLITFLAYGYDKAIAGTRSVRVPEGVLLALALAGGTLGTLAGMQIFRHKTRKTSFRLRFWLIAATQVVLIVLYFVVIRPTI